MWKSRITISLPFVGTFIEVTVGAQMGLGGGTFPFLFGGVFIEAYFSGDRGKEPQKFPYSFVENFIEATPMTPAVPRLDFSLPCWMGFH